MSAVRVGPFDHPVLDQRKISNLGTMTLFRSDESHFSLPVHIHTNVAMAPIIDTHADFIYNLWYSWLLMKFSK